MSERRKPEDFNSEIEAHIRLEADRNRERGMSEEDALAAARRAFGNVAKTQERFYESGRWLWCDTLRQDIRGGLRLLAKTPGWAVVAVLTVALGIGATTAIFSVIDALLLRSLPVKHPEQLVMLTKTFADDYIYTFPIQNVANFADLEAFSGLTAVSPVDRSGFVIGGSSDVPDASQTRIGLVLGNYFYLLTKICGWFPARVMRREYGRARLQPL
jgi:hypothetical protein